MTNPTDATNAKTNADKWLQILNKINVKTLGSDQEGMIRILDCLDAWNLKLLGYIRLVRAVIPDQIKRRDGRIVNKPVG